MPTFGHDDTPKTARELHALLGQLIADNPTEADKPLAVVIHDDESDYAGRFETDQCDVRDVLVTPYGRFGLMGVVIQ